MKKLKNIPNTSTTKAIEKLNQGKLLKGVYLAMDFGVLKKAYIKRPCLIYKRGNHYEIFYKTEKGKVKKKLTKNKLIYLRSIEQRLKYLKETGIDKWDIKNISKIYKEVFGK